MARIESRADLRRQNLQQVLVAKGYALQERRAPVSIASECRWHPAQECVPWFQLGESNYSGCSNAQSLQPWCSHNFTYSGLWSRCKFGCMKKEAQNVDAVASQHM
eukprot:CAMPEP_0169384498 /NCGR_PEP_ID=MMETSP1017-20121227/43465_1 /TAXON_ID=342587 /ORGANISM="Karlodinium micrum, Strain CCMP2283" /LENGTH=104 /DNA_ID=CAMNT_0009485071 /DNA_START=419 /DNA_END=730 /DNA_ORIENTATION=-